MGLSTLGLTSSCRAAFILANGLWFQSSEAVFGSWLACVMTGHSGCALLKYCSLQCTLLCARKSWQLDAHSVLLAFKSAHASAWVAMLKCGDSLPMANIVQLTIGVTPSPSLLAVSW
jgi:hypothetical protein